MRRALFAITALLLIARAQDAAAQCSISVFDLNGTPTLCSDYGDDWRWTGPNGFTSSSMCIDATTPGTYTLRVFDFATNTWSEPCSHLVGDPPTAPGCSIAGPDSVCAGQSVLWCSPTGDFTVTWNGPNGFTSTAACITVSTPGTYTLAVTDNATGMASDPCSQTLRVVDCTPPAPIEECPANARWWASVMGSEAATVATARQSTIASEVDDRSQALNFGGSPAGLHELLSPKKHGRAWHAARRHFAAVLSNMVADGMNVTDANGRTIGLSANMTLDVTGVPAGTTLGAWVAATDATLSGLDENSGRGLHAREACRRIKRQAKEINSGAQKAGCFVRQALIADDDDDDMDGFGGDATLTTFGSGNGLGGSPFSAGGGVRFTLERSDEVVLDVIDLAGRHVKSLARGTFAAGAHDRTWDGRSDSGEQLRPGAYFVAGRIGTERVAQKLIIVR